jgi:hypothetical protein
MSKNWEAPRIAYELAAEWAQQAQDLAAQHGDPRGQDLPQLPALGKTWHDLVQRHDVIDALSAQARGALWELHEKMTATLGQAMGFQIDDMDYYSNRICERADQALFILTRPEPGEWTMPECTHCQAVIAECLIQLQIAAIRMIGAEPATVLRTIAEQLQQQAGKSRQ